MLHSVRHIHTTAALLLAATVLAGCGATKSSAADADAAAAGKAPRPMKTYTDETLTAVLRSAPAVDGTTITQGSVDDITAARNTANQLALGTAIGQVTPAGCAGPLATLLQANASPGARAVGQYGPVPVELHAFPEAADAQQAVAAIGTAADACAGFQMSTMGSQVAGTVTRIVPEGVQTPGAAGASVSVGAGTDQQGVTGVSATAGNVVVTARPPKGTAPSTTAHVVDALVGAVKADLAR